ncbi:hypothetical protein PBY51_002292 [Eleginops maclovinus]|uniref:Pre-mRNA cleavage complex 2 protein Pcf11 n=1 Tax=Eleginops maclovinus TaxID=56733 RepID=A0AAN7XCH0_ELEMC|nr:hypothetical protein PBY51_002292 [Eleginops maclovinus]
MADKDACREYLSSLEDLTFNSKPHINMLTILAEENLHFAKEIVAIIEAQISKAPSAEKLPVLYLVDSIVKNVGGEYLAVFAKNLITSFICVFEKVDENTRKSLFKLRSTWDDVFPLKKLYALDVRVNSVDPAWPIKALPPSVSNASIHVNPKFLKQSDEAPSPQPTPSKPPAPQAPAPLPEAPAPPVAPATPSGLTQESLIRQQLLAKQKQLLELQQKKIELELEQTKAQLAGGFVMPPAAPVKPSPPVAPGVRPWLPPPQPDPKPPTRDPRLNRPAGPPTKEQPAGKKEGRPLTGNPASVPGKGKPAEPETKKDPRLKKRGGAKEEELKEKKKKEEPPRGGGNKGKTLNGSKHEDEKLEFKAGGNARTHARKRSRSPPASPTKRKERRRTRSSSLSPSPSHKPGKPPRREPEHGKKKSQSESRRSKRPAEDPPHSPRGHEGAKEGKEGKEGLPPHRWRSGWEENKHPKPEDPHLKPAPPRHKPYSTPTRAATPRTPKHRLSVDANMQIPEVLNSASKKDLLRRASKRLESGEISQEDFLNMAHQIKHFFQYQEEKQRSDGWDPLSGSLRPLSSGTPRPLSSGTPRPPQGMDAAELSYYEHKLKLRKTQVNRRAAGEEWDGEESPEEGEATGVPLIKYNRGPRERPAERRGKEEEPRPPLGPMIEEYNHGKEFPTLKSLPGLRFRRRADPREPSEREWTSPLTERQRSSEEKSGYEAPRRYDPRRPEGPPLSSVSPAEVPRFERERLSPPKDSESPAPRFESPTSEHSDDGPLEAPPSHLPPPPKSILKAPLRGGPLTTVRNSDSPGHTPPQDGGTPPTTLRWAPRP